MCTPRYFVIKKKLKNIGYCISGFVEKCTRLHNIHIGSKR